MSGIKVWNPYDKSDSLMKYLKSKYAPSSHYAEYTRSDIKSRNSFFSPRFAMYEDNIFLYIELVIPGYDVGDLSLVYEDNTLLVEGIPQPDDRVQQTGKYRYYNNEIRIEPFTKYIDLPVNVNADEINASLKMGILRIQIPKASKKISKKILLQ